MNKKSIAITAIFILFIWIYGAYVTAKDEKEFKAKKTRETASLKAFMSEFESGEFVPEPGYSEFFGGCCDPDEEAYLVFNYPIPDAIKGPGKPTAYEIQYHRGEPPRRIVWFESPKLPGARFGNGYGTNKTYQEFLKQPLP